MELKSPYPDTYEVFFDTGGGFSERNSVRYIVKRTEEYREIGFGLPPGVEQIRIDFGEEKSIIQVKSITLRRGLFTLCRWNPIDILDDFTPFNDLEGLIVKDGILYVCTQKGDPGMVLGKKVLPAINSYLKFTFYGAIVTIALFLFFLDFIISFFRKSNFSGPLVILWGLSATPIILFLSTSNTLYLKNQDMLGYRIAILGPFLILAVIVFAAGGLLYLLSRRPLFKYLLWAYLIAGPFFVLYCSLRKFLPFLDSPYGVFLYLSVMLLVSLGVSKKVAVSKAMKYFAVFGLLLFSYEGLIFATDVKLRDMDKSFGSRQFVAGVPDSGRDHMPNIYHIILDEYQTCMFEKTLTPEIRQALGGFVFFRKNLSNYGGTALSVPSVFTGSRMGRRNMNEYHRDAFDNDASLLYSLKKAGYTTYAYLFKNKRFYPSKMTLFDRRFSLADDSVIKDSLGYEKVFRMLWVYRTLPTFLSKTILSEDDLKAFLAHKMLPSHFELLSYYGMVDFIHDERFLAGHGRYTFVHVLLPHRPYVLCADCSYSRDENGIKGTSGEEQAACATKLIVEFVNVSEETKQVQILFDCYPRGPREKTRSVESHGAGPDQRCLPCAPFDKARGK